MSTTFHTNGTNGHAPDEDIDQLYAWWPGTAPAAPAVCPEACFSLTLKGKLGGIEALLTVRGQTAMEFKANLEAIRGMLDAPQAPAAAHGHAQTPQRQREAGPVQEIGWCAVHHVEMTLQSKNGQQ